MMKYGSMSCFWTGDKITERKNKMELLNIILVALPIYTLVKSIICLVSQVREDRKNGIIKNIWEY